MSSSSSGSSECKAAVEGPQSRLQSGTTGPELSVGGDSSTDAGGDPKGQASRNSSKDAWGNQKGGAISQQTLSAAIL